MKYAAYLWGGMIFCVVLVIVLLLRVFSLESQIRSLGAGNSRALTTFQDSVKQLQAELATAKEMAPGLGEYMTTIQLHVGKLWFASKASLYCSGKAWSQEPRFPFTFITIEFRISSIVLSRPGGPTPVI